MASNMEYGEKGSVAVLRAKRHIYFLPFQCNQAGEDTAPGSRARSLVFLTRAYPYMDFSPDLCDAKHNATDIKYISEIIIARRLDP